MEVGDRIGRYELRRELGRGGMGAVWAAHDPEAGREVALKLVLDAAADAKGRARFAREAEALAQLRHARIVTIHEVGEVEGRPFLVMDLIEGRSLADLVAQGGPLEPALAARVGADIAAGLAHAHERGVLHRDVKPGNVLVTPEGRALLGDFGLAKRALGSKSLTEPGALVGTVFYMAPEQFGGEPASGRSDLYSLGASLYEALCGQPPFLAETAAALVGVILSSEPDPPSRVRADLPADLDAVVLRCLAKAPEDRYAGAAELGEDLERFLAGEPVAARRRGSGVGGGRAWAWAAGLAGVGVLLALAAIWFVVLRPRHAARDELAAIRRWQASSGTPWAFGLRGEQVPAPAAEELAAHRERLEHVVEVLGEGEVGPDLVSELDGLDRIVRLRSGAPTDPPLKSANEVPTAAEALTDALVFVQRGEVAPARRRLERALALRVGYAPAEVLTLRLLAEDDPPAFLLRAEASAGWARDEARRRFAAAATRWIQAQLESKQADAGAVAGAKALRRVSVVAEALELPPSAVVSAKREAFERVAERWTQRVGDRTWPWELAAYEAWAALIASPPRFEPGPKLLELCRSAVTRHLRAFEAAARTEGMSPASNTAIARLVRVDEIVYHGLGWRGSRGVLFGRALEMARGVNLEEERARLLLATLREGLSIWASDAASHVSHQELSEHARRWPESQAIRYARFLTEQRIREGSLSERLASLRGVVLARVGDLAPIYRGRVWREIATLLQAQIQADRKLRTPEMGQALVEAARKARTNLIEGDRRLLHTYGYMRRHGWLQQGFAQEIEGLRLGGGRQRQRLVVWQNAAQVFSARMKEAIAKKADPGLDQIHYQLSRTMVAGELKALGDASWRGLLREIGREVEALGASPEPGVRDVRRDLKRRIERMRAE